MLQHEVKRLNFFCRVKEVNGINRADDIVEEVKGVNSLIWWSGRMGWGQWS